MSKHQFLDLFTEAVKQRLADYDLKSVPAALVSAAFSLYARDLPEDLPIREFKDAGRAEILLQEKIVKPVCVLGELPFTKEMYSLFADTFAVIAMDEVHSDTDYRKYMLELRKRLTANKTRLQQGNVTTFLEMILEDHPDLTDTEYADKLLQRGHEKALEYAESTAIECETIPDSNFHYKTDYDLGDVVSVDKRTWGVTVNMRITGIDEVYERGGVRIVPTFGTPIATAIDWSDN